MDDMQPMQQGANAQPEGDDMAKREPLVVTGSTETEAPEATPADLVARAVRGADPHAGRPRGQRRHGAAARRVRRVSVSQHRDPAFSRAVVAQSKAVATARLAREREGGAQFAVADEHDETLMLMAIRRFDAMDACRWIG